MNNKANAIEKVSSIQEYSHKHKDAGTTNVNGKIKRFIHTKHTHIKRK